MIEPYTKDFNVGDDELLVVAVDSYHFVLQVVPLVHLRCRKENYLCLRTIQTEVLLFRPYSPRSLPAAFRQWLVVS